MAPLSLRRRGLPITLQSRPAMMGSVSFCPHLSQIKTVVWLMFDSSGSRARLRRRTMPVVNRSAPTASSSDHTACQSRAWRARRRRWHCHVRGFYLSTVPPVRRPTRAKSTICMTGGRTEIAEKVPILDERDGVDGARTGIWLKREPCQDGCRWSNTSEGAPSMGKSNIDSSSVTTVGSIWPSTSFRFIAPTRRDASAWPRRSGAASCWSSSLRCRPVLWGLRPAVRPILGRAS